MKFKLISFILTSLACTLISGAALAHHSFAMFDSTQTTVLEGTVREFQWTNPHCWIQILVIEGGTTNEYSIEANSLNILVRRGWARTALSPGDMVKVTIHPLKSGDKGGSLMKVNFPDGHELNN